MKTDRSLYNGLPGQNDPHIGASVPPAATIVTKERGDFEPRALEPPRHLRHRECAKREREAVHARLTSAAFGELLIEDRAASGPILTHGFHQRDVRPAATAAPSLEADPLPILLPRRQVCDQLEPERAVRL